MFGEKWWRDIMNFPMKKTHELEISDYLATMGFELPKTLATQIRGHCTIPFR